MQEFNEINEKLKRGEISFSDIFKEIPVNILAKGINTNVKEIEKKIVKNIDQTNFAVVYKIAEFIGFDSLELLYIVGKEMPPNQKK